MEHQIFGDGVGLDPALILALCLTLFPTQYDFNISHLDAQRSPPRQLYIFQHFLTVVGAPGSYIVGLWRVLDVLFKGCRGRETFT